MKSYMLIKVWEARSRKHEVAWVVGCEHRFINPVHRAHAPSTSRFVLRTSNTLI